LAFACRTSSSPTTRFYAVPETVLDRWAAFDPRWVGVYQSAYLLIGFLPGLARTRGQMLGFAKAFALLTACSLPVFLFFPTRIDRPVVAVSSGLYKMLLTYDGPFNALPSLHAGFLYLTLAFTYRLYDRPPATLKIVLVGSGLLIWSALILWSTLTTKEHHALDLLAGVALAVICDWAAWRRRGVRRGTERPSIDRVT